MPVRKSNYNRLREDNEFLRAELLHYSEMEPYLGIAQEIKERILEQLDDTTDEQTAAEIGEIAFRSVMDAEMERAELDLIQKYERAHRDTLYQRVVKELDEKEGPTIFEQVVQRLETDPELAQELQDSARKELRAEAEEAIVGSVTEAQKKLVEEEVARQIELDRLDVRFALERKLSLNANAVISQLKPHDTVKLHLMDQTGHREGWVLLEWREDINGAKGWLYKGFYIGKDSNVLGITDNGAPTDQFIELGCNGEDLVSGTQKFLPNELHYGATISLKWKSTSQRNRTILHNALLESQIEAEYYEQHDATYIHNLGKYVKRGPLLVRATDFQTRPIEFA